MWTLFLFTMNIWSIDIFQDFLPQRSATFTAKVWKQLLPNQVLQVTIKKKKAHNILKGLHLSICFHKSRKCDYGHVCTLTNYTVPCESRLLAFGFQLYVMHNLLQTHRGTDRSMKGVFTLLWQKYLLRL